MISNVFKKNLRFSFDNESVLKKFQCNGRKFSGAFFYNLVCSPGCKFNFVLLAANSRFCNCIAR